MKHFSTKQINFRKSTFENEIETEEKVCRLAVLMRAEQWGGAWVPLRAVHAL